MNSNAASCSAARLRWETTLGFAICVVGLLWFGLLFVKDLAVALVWNPSKEWISERQNAGCLVIAALSFAFIPGLFCLFFYVFAPSGSKLSGVAEGWSWWWVWLT